MEYGEVLEGFSFTNGLKNKLRYQLTLDTDKLTLVAEDDDEKKKKTIHYSDIIGVQLGVETTSKSASSDEDSATSLTHSLNIYSYPSTKSMFSSKCTRKRQCTTVSLSCLDTAELSKQALLQLKDKIDEYLRSSQVDGGTRRFSKPLLILLNPASGKGNARRLFKEKVSPMLKEAGVEFSVIETERQGHGTEIALNADLEKYYGIVIVSGDGLLYEVYQGLMSRTDSDTAIRTPIGVLPAGSGNALCCSINYVAGEPFMHDMLIHSSYVLLKHELRPMDIVAIDTVAGRVYSFLSVTWGMIADIDIESERFRNLGNARFTVEAISRIISPRTYRGKLSFLPIAPYVNKGRSKSVATVIDHEPLSTDRMRSVSMPLAHSVTHNGTEAKTEANVEPKEAGDNAVNEGGSADTPLTMPTLYDNVPDDWVTVEDNFISIIASYQSHLGPELMATPAATLSDGLIYLLIIRAPVTRMQMLTVMGQLETGAHVKNPLIELVAVRAFRLEPALSQGNMVVDGEKVPYGPIQGSVLPGVACVMAK